MNETLPKTNNGYVTAGILKFIANKPHEFFVNTFAHHQAAVRQLIKKQEFDSDARKAEVESLLGEGTEDDNTTATSAEINFVGRISTWLHEFISPALLDTMKGVDDWKREKESQSVLKSHFQKSKAHNLGKSIHKTLNPDERKEDEELDNRITTDANKKQRRNEKRNKNFQQKNDNNNNINDIDNANNKQRPGGKKATQTGEVSNNTTFPPLNNTAFVTPQPRNAGVANKTGTPRGNQLNSNNPNAVSDSNSGGQKHTQNNQYSSNNNSHMPPPNNNINKNAYVYHNNNNNNNNNNNHHNQNSGYIYHDNGYSGTSDLN